MTGLHIAYLNMRELKCIPPPTHTHIAVGPARPAKHSGSEHTSSRPWCEVSSCEASGHFHPTEINSKGHLSLQAWEGGGRACRGGREEGGHVEEEGHVGEEEGHVGEGGRREGM